MNAEPSRTVEFESIDSTNSEAHRRAAAGDYGPLWIRADRQETGRGRSGRPWASPPGNFSATYLFAPDCQPTAFHQLSFVAGIAAFDAIEPQLHHPASLRLKWPNDLLIEGAKIGGILVESSRYAGRSVIMIGIGINITIAPEVPGRAITRIASHGIAPSPHLLLQKLSATLSHWLDVWDNGTHFSDIRAAWEKRAHAPGQPLTVNTNDRLLEGKYAGIGCNGALLLTLDSGDVLRLEHGDVSLASPIPPSQERA